MLLYCRLMGRVQVNRPVTRKWYLLQLSFQLTQNSTRSSQSSLHYSCKGTNTFGATHGIAAYKGVTTASALWAGERLASRSGHLIPTERASLTYYNYSGDEYKCMSWHIQLWPCTTAMALHLQLWLWRYSYGLEGTAMCWHIQLSPCTYALTATSLHLQLCPCTNSYALALTAMALHIQLHLCTYGSVLALLHLQQWPYTIP
jgi:hypothetical protein